MITKIGILYQKGYDRLARVVDRYKDDANGIMEDPEAEEITYGVIPSKEYSNIANALNLENTLALPGRLKVVKKDLEHILYNHVNTQYRKKKTKYSADQLLDYFKQINDRIDSGNAVYNRLPSISKNKVFYTNQILLPLEDMPLLDTSKVPITYLQLGSNSKDIRVRSIYPDTKYNIVQNTDLSNNRHKIPEGAELIFRNDNRYKDVFNSGKK